MYVCGGPKVNVSILQWHATPIAGVMERGCNCIWHIVTSNINTWHSDSSAVCLWHPSATYVATYGRAPMSHFSAEQYSTMLCKDIKELPLTYYHPFQAFSIPRFVTDWAYLGLVGLTNLKFGRIKCAFTKTGEIEMLQDIVRSSCVSIFTCIAVCLQARGGTPEYWNLHSFAILCVINYHFALIL